MSKYGQIPWIVYLLSLFIFDTDYTDLLVLFATLFTGCHEILVEICFPFISHL